MSQTSACCAARRRCLGQVASETTAHRAIKAIDADLLEAIRVARARALRRAWDAGARPKELILDIDASLLTAHSEKESAAGTYKGGFGFFPLLCYLSETGEPLAGVLRPGNAGANTAADHFEVLQLALEQLPEQDLDREILVRADIGGRTHAFTSGCREAGIRFSVGYEVDERVREAIGTLPDRAWQQAIDGDGIEREGAQVTELTDRLDLSTWPEGSRLIARRERPHPGAQLSVLDCETGYRHTAFITDQQGADIAALELRHRRRARVEDAIRVAKETGMRRMPFAAFEHNQAWLEISLLAQALLRWAALLCLDGELALAEPKRASACCTSPGAWCARVGERRCGCREAGRGPRRWWRPSRDCGRSRPLRVRSHRLAPQSQPLLAAPADPGLPANGRWRSDFAEGRPRKERQGGSEEPPWRCYLPQVT